MSNHPFGCVCVDCESGTYKLHSPEPEMKSLREIKDKLGELSGKLEILREAAQFSLKEWPIAYKKLDAIAESQGKLLAALHETQQGILELTDAIKAAFKEQRTALDGLNAGIAGELGELRKDFSNGGFKAFFGEKDRRLIREFIKAAPPRKRRKR